ncbi:MAG: hypothetical protein GF384_02585 [Elusimicrobia bacterium]|nr:hypothetical protein [Elusimicrobiota bacterium]MBD3411844.1 hypothetical protein [Elusimicrobiota bacterium]
MTRNILAFILNSHSKNKLWLCVLVCLMSGAFRQGMLHAQTDVYIGLEAHGRHLNIGLSSFLPKNISVRESSLCREIESVVRYDLLFSLYFNLIEGGPVPSPEGIIDFKQWADLGAHTVIIGLGEIVTEGFIMNIHLFDTQSQELIWEHAFSGSAQHPRALAHRISDEIVLRFTGEKGIAQTKIAFSSDATGSKEIYVCDYDGHNIKRLTNAESISLFPRWSPDGQTIIYTSYKDRNPDLFIMNADGSSDRPLSMRQGLNTAARWSPDGRYIALTMSVQEDPNIFLIDPTGQLVRRLTRARGAEVAPSFSPNGQHVVFTADRPGYPQLYVVDIFGRRTRRLFVGNYCDSPDWSPNGDTIVFSMISGGRYFDIYSIDIFGHHPVRLTFNSRNNENPSWSPDGRFIVFTSKRNRKSEIFVMSADGTNQHRLFSIRGECFTPDWGPFPE